MYLFGKNASQGDASMKGLVRPQGDDGAPARGGSCLVTPYATLPATNRCNWRAFLRQHSAAIPPSPTLAVARLRSQLGGKGANLAEMSRIGLSVPPGLTITTEVCAEYHQAGGWRGMALAAGRGGRWGAAAGRLPGIIRAGALRMRPLMGPA